MMSLDRKLKTFGILNKLNTVGALKPAQNFISLVPGGGIANKLIDVGL